MDANEQRARHLAMAEECAFILDRGDAGDKLYAKSIRAVAALAQQVPADGEWVPEAELLALVAGPYMYHHKMDEAAMREARAFDRCRELTIQNIQTWCAMRRAMLAATPQAPQPVVDASQPQQGAVAHQWDADGERCLRCGDKDWMGGPCNPPTIGQQAVDDACNCPGGSKPASLHAPNCPVRTTENK